MAMTWVASTEQSSGLHAEVVCSVSTNSTEKLMRAAFAERHHFAS